MGLTADEKRCLKEYIRERGCADFRRGEPCVNRNDSLMNGDMHAGCVTAAEMMALVDKA